jgi:hypothetical protein
MFTTVSVSDNNGNGGRSSRRERQNRMEDDSAREEDRLTDDGEEPDSGNTRHSTPHPSPGKRWPSQFRSIYERKGATEVQYSMTSAVF